MDGDNYNNRKLEEAFMKTRMKWTKELPTKPGLYWVCMGEEIDVGYINPLSFCLCGCGCNRMYRADISKFFVDIDLFKGDYFYGPIEPPKFKKESE